MTEVVGGLQLPCKSFHKNNNMGKELGVGTVYMRNPKVCRLYASALGW